MTRAFIPLTLPDIQAAIASGVFIRLSAAKHQRVAARVGVVGETIVTYVQSPDGPLAETARVVQDDAQIVVTSLFGDGSNSYILPSEKFRRFYHQHPDERGHFVPVGEPRTFYKVDRDISFMAPWGSEFFLMAGGALAPEDDKMLAFGGINPAEFEATYEILDAP